MTSSPVKLGAMALDANGESYLFCRAVRPMRRGTLVWERDAGRAITSRPVGRLKRIRPLGYVMADVKRNGCAWVWFDTRYVFGAVVAQPRGQHFDYRLSRQRLKQLGLP